MHNRPQERPPRPSKPRTGALLKNPSLGLEKRNLTQFVMAGITRSGEMGISQ